MNDENPAALSEFRELIVEFIRKKKLAGCSLCGHENFQISAGSGSGRKKYERAIAFDDHETGQHFGEGLLFFILVCENCGNMSFLSTKVFDEWLDDRNQ